MAAVFRTGFLQEVTVFKSSIDNLENLLKRFDFGIFLRRASQGHSSREEWEFLDSRTEKETHSRGPEAVRQCHLSLYLAK